VVGGLIFLFTSVLGAPVVPAVTLAIGFGVLYSLGAEYLVFGSAGDHIANLLGVGRGWSGAKKSDFSYAEALEIRGDFEGAAKIYKDAIWKRKRDPLPYLRLARIRTRAGLHQEATDILRQALGVARFSAQGEALAVREIHEISSNRLGDPSRATPDLARYLERQPEAINEEWARRELDDIKIRIRQIDDGGGAEPSRSLPQCPRGDPSSFSTACAISAIRRLSGSSSATKRSDSTSHPSSRTPLDGS